MVSGGPAQIKIETSPVTRGAVYSARTMVASETVTEQIGFVEMNVLAFEDLYGGKLHAALDRQHPRDLFDVKLLYENEGLTDDLFRRRVVVRRLAAARALDAERDVRPEGPSIRRTSPEASIA